MRFFVWPLFCIGIIILIEQGNGFEEFIIDDGTGQLPIRNFDVAIKIGGAVGDVVNIIGRIRDYNDQRYLLTEIINKIIYLVLKEN